MTSMSSSDPYGRSAQHSETAGESQIVEAGSSSQSSESLGDMVPGNEDAIKPDVPHEWRSNENTVPAGPFLQYLGQQEGRWLGTAMMCLPPANQNSEAAPTLSYSAGGPSATVRGRKLDEQDGWTFWRFDLIVQMIGEEQSVQYSIDLQDDSPQQTYTFFVPGIQQPVHWGFHSCNGLSANADADMWGEPLLWKDVMQRHGDEHLHVMVGGGDQIYNDGFWKCKVFTDWLDIKQDTEKFQHPFTLEMEQTLSSWVLNHYRMHFTHPLLQVVFASIPQVGQKDDHDIFDGWGSYPADLQECPVFQGIFSVLDRFFLIFQQHTTAESAHQDNDMFGPHKCYSFLRMMGPSQALLVPDIRGERTRFLIMSDEHYNTMFQRCEALPPSVKHLVVVLTVPIVFPSLPLSHAILNKIENFKVLKRAMAKTGVGAGILDKFNHVELLDDIEDHYDSQTHEKERRSFILRLQQHAKLSRQRVSFISGDVHAAQVGRLYSFPKMRHLQHDFRFMPQITSSAIWNNPPPDALINLLHKFNKANKLDRHTREKTVKAFAANHPKCAKVLPRRNWCEVKELPAQVSGPANSASRQAGALEFSLRVEDPKDMKAAPEIYVIPVPTYLPAKTYEEKRISYRSRQWLSCFAAPDSPTPQAEF